MKIKAGKLWNGDYPWDHSDGVGLELTGYPFDENDFIQVMQSFSCNPIACRRILFELATTGIKRTTVMASLDFEEIGLRLEEVGVTMRIIDPHPVEVDNSTIDLVALKISLGQSPNLDYLDSQDAALAIKRAQDAGAIDPATLGPYEGIASSSSS